MASDKPTSDDKKDPIKLDSEESPLGSSVDGESGEQGEGEGEGEGSGLANPPEQAPKRKGGRKPVRDKAYYFLISDPSGDVAVLHACLLSGRGCWPGTAHQAVDWERGCFCLRTLIANR